MLTNPATHFALDSIDASIVQLAERKSGDVLEFVLRSHLVEEDRKM